MEPVSYEWYQSCGGASLERAVFCRLEQLARRQLERYERIYQVQEVVPEGRAYAVCAMAEAMDFFEAAANGELTDSIQLGSVQSQRAAGSLPDLSQKAKSRELFRCAALYLDIFRGGESRCCGADKPAA